MLLRSQRSRSDQRGSLCVHRAPTCAGKRGKRNQHGAIEPGSKSAGKCLHEILPACPLKLTPPSIFTMRRELRGLRRAAACCLALGCAWTLWARLGKVEHGVHRLGTHIILEVAGVTFDLLDNATLIPAVLRAAADAASLTVLDEVYHSFPVQGLSGLLLISESHLSYHTWPEHGYASVDLFTCGPPSPLPCRPLDTVRYDGATWTCPDGTRVELSQTSGLWAAVSLIVSALGARGADLTWMERGVPRRLLGAEQHPSDPARLRGVPGQVTRPDRSTDQLRSESGVGAPEL